jgi:DNA processing protein
MPDERRTAPPSPGPEPVVPTGFTAIGRGSAGWPTQLDDLATVPPELFTCGRPLRPALLRSVAIVGSRAATPHGVALATRWAAELAGRGFTIVSGGAFGIDAAAHRGALQAGGHTVAVLAAGVDIDSPRAHGGLLEVIRRRGTVVSELPLGTPPSRHGFLIRNRLIAALAPGTLVVQAAHRSGALNTARQAADLNRVVMAVPGEVTDAAHGGCHHLIRENVAVLVSSADEVAELLTPLTAPPTDQGSSTAR